MKNIIPVFNYSSEVKGFVERGLWNGKRGFGDCSTIGFANEHEGLIAGFVYHNYEPDSRVIEMSAYSSRRDWCTKSILKIIFDYPFNQIDVRLLVARHSEYNKRARRIWKALGAKEYVIPELRNEGEAEAIAVLKKDEFIKSGFMKG